MSKDDPFVGQIYVDGIPICRHRHPRDLSYAETERRFGGAWCQSSGLEDFIQKSLYLASFGKPLYVRPGKSCSGRPYSECWYPGDD